MIFPSPYSRQELKRLTGSPAAGFPGLVDLGLSVKRMMVEDSQQYLPADILVKADRASMRWGLEVRNPFLDKDLYALSQSYSSNELISGSRQKIPLREMAKSHYGIPEKWVEQKKHGFEIPLTAIFRANPERCAIISELTSELLDEKVVMELVAGLKERDVGFRVWLLYALARFIQMMKAEAISYEWK